MFFNDIATMLKYYNSIMQENQSISVVNTIRSESLGFHIYKLPNNFMFNSNEDSKTVMSLCTSNDCYTQVILGKNITINLNTTVTPPYRCRGIIIYATNQLSNYGTISMTSRGCVAQGQDIYLYNDEFVPAVGAIGPEGGVKNTTSNGINGVNGVNRQSGSGATGSFAGHYATVIGKAGNGTSFSGGSGSGSVHPGTWGATGTDASDIGGKGGNSAEGFSSSNVTAGGQGNPHGDNKREGAADIEFICSTYGTGGLIIIYTKKLYNYSNGIIESKGGDTITPYLWNTNFGLYAGGASGGGSINIFYDYLFNQGSLNANGGIQTQGKRAVRPGGKGGNGSITLMKIDTSVFNIFNNNRKNSDLYRNVNENILKYDSLSKLLGL